MIVQSAWESVKKLGVGIWNWTLRYPVALVISVGVILLAVILLLFGVGDRFNLGGILGLLFGHKTKEKTSTIEIVNKVPSKRVDPEGKAIPIGVPDDKGYVQREVEVLDQSHNPFRDKSVIKIDNEVIQLPKGVLDTDVKTVIQVQPEVYQIVVTNRPKHKVTSDDLKYLITFFMFTLVLLVPSLGAAECPEGHKCIPNEVAAKWKEILEHRQCMDDALDGETGKLQLTLEPYTVFLTEEGQVFDQENLDMRLHWCDYDLIFSAKPRIKVVTKAEDDSPEWGFRLRLRLGVALDLTSETPYKFEPMVMLEPFYYTSFHTGMFISLKSFGIHVGMDLTKNADVFIGFGTNWDASLTAKLGISLSFN